MNNLPPLTKENITVEQIGIPKIDSPVHCLPIQDSLSCPSPSKDFVDDRDRVLIDISEKHCLDCLHKGEPPLTLEKAGPRQKIFFSPQKTKCAIVTAGGLCPGENDVIRAIVLELYFIYGVKNIIGIPYGYQGFIPQYGHPVIDLTPRTGFHHP